MYIYIVLNCRIIWDTQFCFLSILIEVIDKMPTMYSHHKWKYYDFTFNTHFEKENDCVRNLIIEMPHHRRIDFIILFFVNFVLLTHTNLHLPFEVDSRIVH